MAAQYDTELAAKLQAVYAPFVPAAILFLLIWLQCCHELRRLCSRGCVLLVLQRSSQANVDVLVLVFYDYIITVAQEIRVVWQQSWTFPGVLLILNRYIILFNAVLSVLIDLTWGKSVRLIHKFVELSVSDKYCLAEVADFKLPLAIALTSSTAATCFRDLTKPQSLQHMSSLHVRVLPTASSLRADLRRCWTTLQYSLQLAFLHYGAKTATFSVWFSL